MSSIIRCQSGSEIELNNNLKLKENAVNNYQKIVSFCAKGLTSHLGFQLFRTNLTRAITCFLFSMEKTFINAWQADCRMYFWAIIHLLANVLVSNVNGKIYYISFICLPSGSIHGFLYAMILYNLKECSLFMNAFITFTKTYNLDAVETSIFKMNKLCKVKLDVC